MSGTNDDPTATFAPAKNDSDLTGAGVVVGTAGYMSPEQALGKQTDFRSDQFSFGLILYELASGKRAFAKASTVETMAAIVREEPPPMDEKLPAPLRWIIDRCLQKEPEQRYESTRDLYQELRNLRDHFSEAYSSGELAPVATKAKRSRWQLPLACVGCILFTGLIVYLLKPSGQNIGNYRYTPFATDTDRVAWSPDGKAVVYASKVNGTFQVFLRYLNSPAPVQLTHEKLDTVPFGWSSDRSHLFVGTITSQTAVFSHFKLYLLPTVGGQLEFIMDVDCLACDLSRDGKVFAAITYKGVEVSDPVGSPLRSYMPAPFMSSLEHSNSNEWLSFSPDQKNILLLVPSSDRSDEAWLLPYPGGSKSPLRILGKLSPLHCCPSSSFMPDNHHLAISLAASQDSVHHLGMTDIDSNDVTPLTTGTSEEIDPLISPDGKNILYSQVTSRHDIVSVSVEDGQAKTLISTGHNESYPTWSANQPRLAWSTDRSGRNEIWVRQADGSSRPAVTPENFAGSPYLSEPTFSPNGDRVIYGALGPGIQGMWISSIEGGAPVPLTRRGAGGDWGGAWSPDGSRFAYYHYEPGKPPALMTVKTSGNAVPVLLRANVNAQIPDWSPIGDWITYDDAKGWNLISPDGKTSKFLGKIETPYLAFSKDGKLLYGIQTEAEGDKHRAILFSLDPITLKQKVIKDLGKELQTDSPNYPGIQFSLAPDGKSLVYSTAYYRQDLWILTGYRQPGWRARIAEALNLK